jgi:TPR repeat protein
MSLLWKVVLSATGVAVISVGAVAWWMHSKQSIELKKLSDAAIEAHARADQGDATAEYKLAQMYYEGRGVTQDYSEASRWYRKAAEHGYANAQFGLADLYLHGKGVPQNFAETAHWTQKAADQGYAKAQAGLGYLYSNGVGVSQNYAEAFQWYSKAADQGNVDAEHALGYMYRSGIGVPENHTEAFQWTQKAADQGDAEAQVALGSMYGNGVGVQQNRTEAYRWFRKAADQGNPEAKQALKLLRNGSMTGMRWVELCVGLAGLVVGLWAALEFLLPGKTLKNRRQAAVTLLGAGMLSNAGLSLYFATHYDLRFSPHWQTFHIARYIFAAALIPLAAIVVLTSKKIPGQAGGPGLTAPK